MATTLDNTNEDLIFYHALKSYIFTKAQLTPEVDKHNQWMIKHGMIQIETLLEMAISKVGRIKRESTHGKDFVDGSDAKKTTSCWRMNGKKRKQWTNSYQVRGIKNKRGTLRIMGYNRAANCIDYYAIPYKAYKQLTGQSLDIVLDSRMGYTKANVPPPTGRSASCKWDQYRVSTLRQMARSY